MVMTDPIADFLTRIRNANQAKHEVLEVPASNIKKGIAEILKREGFVKNVEIIEDDKQGIIRVFLKYGPNGEKVITNLKRVSKPGLRVYKNVKIFQKFLTDLELLSFQLLKVCLLIKKLAKRTLVEKLSLTFGKIKIQRASWAM